MPGELFDPREHQLADHEDGLRRLMAEAQDEPYVALTTLNQAKEDAEGVVILQGDDGGQIYVVCPASKVACTEADLDVLLHDLDGIEWPGNDPDSARVFYERRPIGEGIGGGMGGGSVAETVWVHPRLLEKGLAPEVGQVLSGTKRRVSLPPTTP
jgi:hypothetical protein